MYADIEIYCDHWNDCPNSKTGCCDLEEGRLCITPCIEFQYEGSSLEMPSMIEQAKNLTVATIKVGKALYNGDDVLVSDKVKTERQKICDTCEFYEAQSKRCSKCGCATEYKLGLATEECPEGKWQATKKKKPSFMLVNLNKE